MMSQDTEFVPSDVTICCDWEQAVSSGERKMDQLPDGAGDDMGTEQGEDPRTQGGAVGEMWKPAREIVPKSARMDESQTWVMPDQPPGMTGNDAIVPATVTAPVSETSHEEECDNNTASGAGPARETVQGSPTTQD